VHSFLRRYGISIAIGALSACLLIFIAAGSRLYRHAALLVAPPPAATTSAVITSTIATELIGGLDVPVQESLTGHRLEFSGWAFDPTGVRAVEIRFPHTTYMATLNVPRNDVRDASPSLAKTYAGIGRSGFEAQITLPDSFSSLDRQPIEIIAINRDGKTKSLAKLSWLPTRSRETVAETSSAQNKRAFHLLMMTSGLPFGDGAEIDTVYRDYVSPKIKTGVSVPILYMRTTKGPKGDWRFDPAFDLTRRCDNRLVAEDNLDAAIAYAIEKKDADTVYSERRHLERFQLHLF